MTKDIEVYEQTKITARQGKRLDVESAYIDAGDVIEDNKPKDKRYIHVFSDYPLFRNTVPLCTHHLLSESLLFCPAKKGAADVHV